MSISNTSRIGLLISLGTLDPDANVTTIYTRGPHEETDLLTNWSVFWAMASLATNTVLQRSGADEFPCDGSLSPARISPLICLADMLLACVTILYGLWHGMGLRQSCALYIFNTRRSKSKTRPVIDGRTFPDILIFCLAAFNAVKIFAASGLNHKVIVFTAIYIAAPVVHAITRIMAENNTAQSEVRQFIAAGHGSTLLQVADMFWCAAYACQFTRLVQVGQSLSVHPHFSGQNAYTTNIVLGCIIAAAAIISLFGAHYYFRRRPLHDWARKDWKLSAIALFAITTVTGIPDSFDTLARWRLTFFVPLSVIGVFVLIFWLIAFSTDAVRWTSKALGVHSGLPIHGIESDSEIPSSLQHRLNPLLSGATTHWRRTLVLAFAMSMIFFAVLHYGLLYDNLEAVLPIWTGIFGG